MSRINIEKTIISILTIAMLYAGNAYAEFTVNIDQKAVYKHLGVYVLGDLGVGESAYVEIYIGFCIDRTGIIKILKDIEVVTERSEYGSYFKVKRLPSDKVSLELIPAKSESKHDETIDFLKRLVNKEQALQCNLLYSLFGYSESEMLNVSTVEGAASLKELLSKTKR